MQADLGALQMRRAKQLLTLLLLFYQGETEDSQQRKHRNNKPRETKGREETRVLMASKERYRRTKLIR